MKKIIATLLLSIPMIGMNAQSSNTTNASELRTGIITSMDQNGNGTLVDSETGVVEIIVREENSDHGALAVNMVGDNVVYLKVVTPVRVIRVIKNIRN